MTRRRPAQSRCGAAWPPSGAEGRGSPGEVVARPDRARRVPAGVRRLGPDRRARRRRSMRPARSSSSATASRCSTVTAASSPSSTSARATGCSPARCCSGCRPTIWRPGAATADQVFELEALQARLLAEMDGQRRDRARRRTSRAWRPGPAVRRQRHADPAARVRLPRGRTGDAEGRAEPARKPAEPNEIAGYRDQRLGQPPPAGAGASRRWTA